MKIFGFALSDYGWALQIANILLIGLCSYGALWMRHKFVGYDKFDVALERIGKLEMSHTIDAAKIPSKAELAELELRILAVEAGDKISEERMKSLATKEDVSHLMEKLAEKDGDRRELAAKVSGLQDEIRKMSVPLDTIYKHLLQWDGQERRRR